MLNRAMLGGLIACSLMVIGIATTADAAKRNTLRGQTHQGMRIKLAVGNDAVKILRFKVDLRCRDGSTLQVDESGFLKTPLRSNGSFRDIQYGSTDTVYIRGRVSGKTVGGKLRVTDRLHSGGRCQSRWVKFKAH
jgi:hypothetical protein